MYTWEADDRRYELFRLDGQVEMRTYVKKYSGWWWAWSQISGSDKDPLQTVAPGRPHGGHHA
jgi:hypothetical protein